MNPRTNEYHADDGRYGCLKCKLATNINVTASCTRVLKLDDDGLVLDASTYNETYDQNSTAECDNPKCGHKGKLREFLIGYRDNRLDACPDCEHPMAIMPEGIGADGKPTDDAEVFCPECEGQLHKLADWKAKGWRCLESIVVFYKFTRKSCPSCGQSTEFVDVTGKARDGYMLCRCGPCTHWWAEPEDGHPSHSF